jgi:nucleoside-diphosphate-sugar epimerase
MHVLIAGCGYVGSELGRRLAARGDVVWGLRRNPENLPSSIRPLAADLLDPDLGSVLPTVSLAVYAASPDESSDEGYRRSYVEGLGNFVSALRRTSPDLRRLLLISSTGVYGDRGGAEVDEDTAPEPDDFRGRRLLEGEEFALSSGLPVTILRLGGIYGPGRTRLLDLVREGRARCPEGAPVWSNRIHLDDAARAAAHLLSLSEPEPVYLGVDAEPTPICEVYRSLARLLDAPEPEPEGEGARRRGNKRCSSARLRESGFEFKYPSFREGYADLVEAGW